MYYLGIDLQKDESHVAVLDDDAEVVEEIRVKNANLDEVAEEYAGAKAVIEATSNYYRSTTPSTNTSTWLSQIRAKPRRSAMLR